MSLQHRPLRSSLASIAITGAAALATVLAGAPAMADDATIADPADSTQTADPEATPPADGEPAPATDETSTEPEVTPEAPVDETETPAAPETIDETAETGDEATDTDPRADRLAAAAAEGEVVADFGYQKFRVGVQIADGSFVPEGGTVGSTFTITISGGDGGTREIECTTEGVPADSVENPDGFSTCPGEDFILDRAAMARSVEITEGSPFAPSTYALGPNETATIVQTSAVEGLEQSPETAVIAPCSADPEPEPGCGNSFPFPAAADVLFENEGTPPDAVNDSATTDEGEAVDVDLLANDDPSIAPITGVEIDADASNGTVAIDDEGVARYTPDDDFRGTDTFTYALTTQNGTDTATVTVEVEGIEPVAEKTEEPRAAANVSSLPNTGGPDLSLLGIGALLMTVGGWVTLRSRRRVGALDRG